MLPKHCCFELQSEGLVRITMAMWLLEPDMLNYDARKSLSWGIFNHHYGS